MAAPTETGVYYPSGLGFLSFRVLRENLMTSNDFGVACHEMRHFIDEETLSNLQGGSLLLSSLVECVPRCVNMGGKGMSDQVVVGMLADPLQV